MSKKYEMQLDAEATDWAEAWERCNKENTALRAEVERLREERNLFIEGAHESAIKKEQLQATVDTLKKDLRRYIEAVEWTIKELSKETPWVDIIRDELRRRAKEG